MLTQVKHENNNIHNSNGQANNVTYNIDMKVDATQEGIDFNNFQEQFERALKERNNINRDTTFTDH